MPPDIDSFWCQQTENVSRKHWLLVTPGLNIIVLSISTDIPIGNLPLSSNFIMSYYLIPCNVQIKIDKVIINMSHSISSLFTVSKCHSWWHLHGHFMCSSLCLQVFLFSFSVNAYLNPKLMAIKIFWGSIWRDHGSLMKNFLWL